MVKVPEVDPIEHAYLASFALSTQALAKRKELLMKRRVTDVTEFMKIKKQKREIRMLGN